MRLFRFFFCLTFVSMQFSASAQNKSLGGWYQYFGNIGIKETPLRIHAEIQDRNHFTFRDLDQLLLRFGLQYNYKDQVYFKLGYGHIRSEMIGDIDMPKNENRIYQEVFIPQRIQTVRFQHRFRYEQRFIEEIDFRTRFRYAFTVNVPLYYFNKEKNNKVYAAISNEVFLHGEKRNEYDAIFDRNRLYLGAGYRFNHSLTMQFGWMNQIFADFSQPKMVLSLHHNFDI